MWDDCLVNYTKGGVLDEPNQAQQEAARPINWIYGQDWGAVGGPLHCEIEDHNLEDHWFEGEEIERQPWHSGLTNIDWDNCNRLFWLLKTMTEAERAQTMVLASDADGPYH